MLFVTFVVAILFPTSRERHEQRHLTRTQIACGPVDVNSGLVANFGAERTAQQALIAANPDNRVGERIVEPELHFNDGP